MIVIPIMMTLRNPSRIAYTKAKQADVIRCSGYVQSFKKLDLGITKAIVSPVLCTLAW